MGYIEHNAVVVVCFDCPPEKPAPDVEGFRATLPDEFARLLIGPITAAVNGDLTYCFLPDGSKEGWTTSNEGDEYRRSFVELFRDCYADIAHIRFGGDDPDIQWIEDPLKGYVTGRASRG